jgi:hypothetical protein
MAQNANDAAAQMQQIIAQNAAQRQWCIKNGVAMSQIVDTRTLTGTPNGQQPVILLRPVGLLKSVIVQVDFDIAQTAAETLTRTALGPANIFSNITFTDLNNNQRISTPGWHLTSLATMRRGSAFGAVYTNNSPYGMGADNYSAILCPATVSTTQHVRMFYEIPVAYSDYDLRGAIPLNVTGATAQIQLTVNQNLVAASTTTDATESVFQSSTTAQAVPTNFKITTYQNYLDQIPSANLPILDLQTVYQLQYTSLQGLAAGQDFPIQYGNQREFYSTTVWFDQNGTLNPGSDVNYFALTTANFTNLWKKSPQKAALDTRLAIGNDTPLGMYYFDHRKAPINTATFGNMQLVINPLSVAGANTSLVKVGWEFFTMVQLATRISSLAAG